MMVCTTLNLLRLDRLPIAIAPFSLPTNATLKLSDLRKKMKSHVIRQFTVQSGRILASVDNAGTVSVGLRRAQDKLAELSGDTTKNTVSSREKGATTSVSAGVKNIGQTYVDGTVNLVGGALSGVAGVFYKPVEGFRQEGLRGAAIGGFKGVTVRDSHLRRCGRFSRNSIQWNFTSYVRGWYTREIYGISRSHSSSKTARFTRRRHHSAYDEEQAVLIC